MKVARTVLSEGKDGVNFTVLPIVTTKNNPLKFRGFRKISMGNYFMRTGILLVSNLSNSIGQ